MIRDLCSRLPKARVTASSPYTFPRRIVPWALKTRSFSSRRCGEWSELSFYQDLSFFTNVQTESPRLATVSAPDYTSAKTQQLPSDNSSLLAMSINAWSTDSNTTKDLVSYTFWIEACKDFRSLSGKTDTVCLSLRDGLVILRNGTNLPVSIYEVWRSDWVDFEMDSSCSVMLSLQNSAAL